MKDDPIWQAFRETGDPLYYLLYKTTAKAAEKKPAQKTVKSGG